MDTSISEGATSMVGFFLYLTYFLFFAGAAMAIVWPIVHAVGNPKQLKGLGMALGAIVVLYLIGYGIAGDEVTAIYTKFDITSTGSKMVGSVLITTYFLGFIAIIGIVASEVNSVIKSKS